MFWARLGVGTGCATRQFYEDLHLGNKIKKSATVYEGCKRTTHLQYNLSAVTKEIRASHTTNKVGTQEATSNKRDKQNSFL